MPSRKTTSTTATKSFNWAGIVYYNSLNAFITICAFLSACKSPSVLIAIIFASTLLLCAKLLFGKEKLSFDVVGKFVKVMCEMPLGLGAVMVFAALSPQTQMQHIGWFTAYVNFAVLGNIAMMVAVPADGTVRGVGSRFVCLVLSVWLGLEMHKVNWQTVRFENGAFIFIASPLKWVLCHAVYRFIMVSLPIFENLCYMLLEPFSLTFMVLLHHGYARVGGHENHPVSFYFGYSDTLVVVGFLFCFVLLWLACIAAFIKVTVDLTTLNNYDIIIQRQQWP